MASGAREPRAGVPRVSRGCSGPFPSSTQFCCEDHPSQGSGQTKGPPVVEGSGSHLPRNVLSERERRRRISLSCERLRALLPRFDGRREDMASVLEMAVQFLQLAGTLVPGWEQQALLASSKEPWLAWQTDVLQLALASQAPAGAPDAGAGTSSVMHQTPPSCAATGVDEDEALSGVADVLDRPLAPPESPGLVPRSPGPRPPKVLRPSPLWPVRSQQPPSPLVSEEPRSCQGQAGPPAQGADKALTLDSRSVSGCDVADGASFLLTPGPDWWLGSLEGRGSGAPSRVAARSSPLDRLEPGFLGDPESGPQEEPLDGPLGPWGSDGSCPSPVLRDEVDSIFPDFFAC
ncbi:spermatogenesis- and oogenesis-specific basic helix-loop-helix-containing protein 1 isoform X1 [Cervus canadensis]|uniref:spermatogenesis- and oogenesis-specific basic helix-loop-helix-containing protein 1 isoform X1 n=1 Tax=Cervus canadensis TaxID=1574408 RepID=UPI001C9E27F2|nr:spermatogenesis- and oogenesis-specific basic helix-loop-helix-containing protein 1 isoform X1 [Cervus canadensis]